MNSVLNEVGGRLVSWLMKGDPAIQYQTSRDLLEIDERELLAIQKRIAVEGWGAKFLSKRKQNGHWGITFYQPKWTSTHYTLLDLKMIGLDQNNAVAKASTSLVLDQPSGHNGGINLSVSLINSDVCVNGMILNYGSYFLPERPRLKAIADFLLDVQMTDGGWNCRYLDGSTSHSSLHSTISVMEGLHQFKMVSRYKRHEITVAETAAVEFLLKHHLHKSHRTGEIIDPRMLRLSFPCRWRYDILRCLDYFANANISFDPRMQMALDVLLSKHDKSGRWPLQEKHRGAVHFDMERIGEPSRWNTLRALRVLKHYNLWP